MTTTRQNVRSDFGTGGTGLAPEGASVAAPQPSAFGSGAIPANPDLVTILWALLGRVGNSVANLAALQAFGATNVTDRQDGMFVLETDNVSLWTWNAASTAVAAAGLVVVTTDAPAAGRFLRVGVGSGSGAIDLKLPIGFATADAAVLFTVPVGMKLLVERAYWEVGTSFTGGAASAIGVSSTDANFNVKGDILGGAGGDVAATLVSTGSPYKGGTLGAKFGTNGVVVLVAGDVVRFDRITSAFTAGAGFVHLEVSPIA